MTLTLADVLAAIRAGATTTTNPQVRTILGAMRRELRGETEQESRASVQVAWDYLRQTVPALAAAIAADEGAALREHLTLLRDCWDKLPATNPDPATPSQDKALTRLRALISDVRLSSQVRDLLEWFKRGSLRDYHNSDPVETRLAAALATITAGTDPVAVRAAVEAVQRDRHLLPANP